MNFFFPGWQWWTSGVSGREPLVPDGDHQLGGWLRRKKQARRLHQSQQCSALDLQQYAGKSRWSQQWISNIGEHVWYPNDEDAFRFTVGLNSPCTSYSKIGRDVPLSPTGGLLSPLPNGSCTMKSSQRDGWIHMKKNEVMRRYCWQRKDRWMKGCTTGLGE